MSNSLGHAGASSTQMDTEVTKSRTRVLAHSPTERANLNAA